jgi:uncharacterized protein (DUF362 family)
MFYQCPQCKKTWQYPIGKCPDCFQKLERVNEGKKVKVIGISRVKIPTILHPQVPYFVLVLEDENKNHWTFKTTREYSVGDDFKTKSLPGKDTVSIWRVKYDVPEGLERAVSLIKPEGLGLGKNSKVLVLPTLVSVKHPYFRENTSPQFLDAALRCLFAQGVSQKNIKVTVQMFDEIPLEAAAAKSRLLEVCQHNNVPPLDIAQAGFIKKDLGGMTLEMSEEAFESDLILNLPIMKMDSELKVRGPLDNILRLLRKESFLSVKGFSEYQKIVPAVQKILPPLLTIAEATSIKKSTDYTASLGLVLASFSPLNLERVFAEITFQKDLPEHLKNIKIQDIPIAGREIKSVQYDIEQFY